MLANPFVEGGVGALACLAFQPTTGRRSGWNHGALVPNNDFPDSLGRASRRDNRRQ